MATFSTWVEGNQSEVRSPGLAARAPTLTRLRRRAAEADDFVATHTGERLAAITTPHVMNEITKTMPHEVDGDKKCSGTTLDADVSKFFTVFRCAMQASTEF